MVGLNLLSRVLIGNSNTHLVFSTFQNSFLIISVFLVAQFIVVYFCSLLVRLKLGIYIFVPESDFYLWCLKFEPRTLYILCIIFAN